MLKKCLNLTNFLNPLIFNHLLDKKYFLQRIVCHMTKQMPQQAQDNKCPYSPHLSLSTPLDSDCFINWIIESPSLY